MSDPLRRSGTINNTLDVSKPDVLRRCLPSTVKQLLLSDLARASEGGGGDGAAGAVYFVPQDSEAAFLLQTIETQKTSTINSRCSQILPFIFPQNKIRLKYELLRRSQRSPTNVMVANPTKAWMSGSRPLSSAHPCFSCIPGNDIQAGEHFPQAVSASGAGFAALRVAAGCGCQTNANCTEPRGDGIWGDGMPCMTREDHEQKDKNRNENTLQEEGTM
ncbi:hypothetical protein NDU88_000975 [Pleurodeles waltl]|uniref:Uncharacterized protein n=1 Tax=Pleurodeles waltl TaxID=8319 RepID=A0AAV7MKF5_PLEWA|nr:hypothetical protein NDU88_000975 [Pleurodeles waltl]